MSPRSNGLPLHRHSYFVWQMSTLLLMLSMAVGLLAFGGTDSVGWPTYTGLGILMLGTFLAFLIQTRVLSLHWRIALPVLSLCALTVMGADILPVAPTTALLVMIPLLWLVFEFGRLGTLLALLSLGAVLATIFVIDIVPSGSGPLWLQFLPLPLSSIGLILGAHQVTEALRRREAKLADQTRQLEETLEKSRDNLLMLRAMLDTVDAVIVAYDDDGTLIWDNPAARRQVSRAGLSTKGEVVHDLHIYGADPTIRLPLAEIPLTRAHRGEEYTTELCWFGPPGDQVAVLLSARQIQRPTKDGSVDRRHGYVIVGLEVTDVMEAIRVREEFLTTVSHELRTPLASIIGYQELIEDALDPADQTIHQMLSIAQRNAQVLLTRVNQLLQSCDPHELVSLAPTTVDVATVMTSVMANHHPAATTLGVHLTHHVAPGLEATLDPDQFEQVVDNLISNALKYTPAGGQVDVFAERCGASLTVRVSDNGIGMSAAEQRHAFQRFYRAAGASRQAIPGLGIGLSVVKSIVEAHGGHVQMTSRPGHGTTISVTVPDTAIVPQTA